MTLARFTLSREHHIPKASIKVCDKLSDAIAYLYLGGQNGTRPCAAIFYGKQSAPIARFQYRDEAEREKSIRNYFETRQAHAARVAENRKAPSSTAVRNAALKAMLEETYGKGKVSVTGDRGTAYGWINARINATEPAGKSYGVIQHEIVTAAKTRGISIDNYGYDDPGSDYGYGYKLNVRFTNE